MPRNYELYKGRKRRRRWPMVLLIILIALIVLALLLFYGLQKYIVYTPTGVRLELPILATPQPAGEDGQPLDVSGGGLVIDETDYSNIEATAGENLSAVKAIYVPAADINADSLAGYAERLSKGNALVLDLKPASGQLAWKSGVSTAENYGVNGALDLAPIVTSLKEKNVWLVAELSCCVDTLLASRSSTLALQTSAGAAYTDSTGGWLNPYSTEVRGYITGLAKELADMGFDEILLTNVCHPSAAVSTFNYAASASTEVTAQSVVASFGLSVTRTLAASGAVVSVVATRDAISGAAGNMNGQNVELFAKIFDRIYCYTDASAYTTYKTACEQYFTVGDKNLRFVPMCAGNLPSTDCWVLTESAG